MKVLVSILLLPLLGGAIFCWTYVGTRYRFTRRSGYHFFFMAAIAGGALLAGIYLPLRVLEMAVPGIEPVFDGWNRFAPPVPYLGTCVASLLIAWPAARLLNRYTDGAKVRREEIEENGDELEQMIMDAVAKAYERPQLYMLTLSNGKVYIGTIMSENDPYGRRQYITVLKFASGYRTAEQRVEVMTSYAHVLQRAGRQSPSEADDEEDGAEPALPEHITVDDFQVVIPKDELIMLSRYEPELRSFFTDGPQMS